MFMYGFLCFICICTKFSIIYTIFWEKFLEINLSVCINIYLGLYIYEEYDSQLQ